MAEKKAELMASKAERLSRLNGCLCGVSGELMMLWAVLPQAAYHIKEFGKQMNKVKTVLAEEILEEETEDGD